MAILGMTIATQPPPPPGLSRHCRNGIAIMENVFRMGCHGIVITALLSWKIFFSHGLPKAETMFDAPTEPLGVVESLSLFASFPVISSWLVTIAELVLIPIFILVGGLKFIGPMAKALSTLGGLLGTLVMLVVIVGFHFGVLDEGISDVKYQLAIFAMSVYFLFK